MAKDKPQSKPKREPTPDVSGSESDYSSDDTIEDEDGDELTPAMDAAILRTLSKIRRKDEGVYGTDNILQTELAATSAQAKKRGLPEKTAQRKAESKPFLLKDLHRDNLLSGVQHDSDDEEDVPLTNYEAERRARAEAVSAFQAVGESDDDSDDEGFLQKREKDDGEEDDDDEAYRGFLLEMGGGEAEVRHALSMADQPLTHNREDSEDEEEETKKSKKKEKLSAEEKEAKKAQRRAKKAQADEDFLMDYILNRGWIDKTAEHVPTFDEIVGRARGEDEESEDESEGEDGKSKHPWGVLDEEEEFDEKADAFETEYNFRFEEPGSSTILTHPRNIATLVRREDDTRKTKRQEREERKAAEKAAREEETRRLKGEKRREMEKLVKSLKQEIGESNVDWEGLEKIMEGEWDESEWERVVGAMLQAKAEAEDDTPEDDEDKPVWDDDDLGDYPEDGEFEGEGEWVEPQEWTGDDVEDDDLPINMDADFEAESAVSKTKARRDKKKGKKGKGKEDAAEDTEGLSVAEKAAKVKAAMNEYRELDHEDEVGGIKTRFKYTKSAPVSYGLTPAEILMATDEELNALISVKHYAPYRRGGLGLQGRGFGRRLRDLKDRVGSRKWGDDMPAESKKKGPHVPGRGANSVALGVRSEPKKRAGKKERQRKAAEAATAGGEEPETAGLLAAVSGKRKREEVQEVQEVQVPVAAGGDGGEGGEGKKKRRKKKKGAA
ncbi:Kinetochore protein Spc24 [Vanrija albida]|uniref:Kinetochore protein Spc24 n=1 Tax=Vanrija albida TaxID=181172 RepID=A0ABR3QCV6_9TREE